MRRIAYIIGDISKSAGTERAVVNLCNSLSGYTEYELYIISLYTKEGEKPYYSLHESVKLVHLELSNKNRVQQLQSYVLMLGKINEVVKQKSINTIVGTGHQINTMLPLISSNVKKIAWEHMIYEAPPVFSRLLRRLSYPKLNHVVLLTEADMKRYRFLKKEIKSTIWNAASFETNEQAELRNKSIVYVGRLSRVKDIPSLIRIMRIVFNELKDWHLDIYGDGEEKEKIISIIDSYNLSDYITIHEPTTNIEAVFLNSSVAVLTSFNEGLPMVLIEAQTCGVPCVAYNCKNGPSEIISDNENGFLINNRDELEFAKKIILLASDEKMRRRFGDSAKFNSLNFNQNSISDKWIRLFGAI